MEHAQLLAWLATPTDFAAGVVLHQQLGGAVVYQQLFALGETRYSRQVLVQQLRALVGVIGGGVEPTQAPTPAAAPPLEVVVVAAGPDPPHENSPLLAAVRGQLKACRDERDLLRAQLTAPGLRHVHRNTMAHRICALTDQVYELEEEQAHVLEHGRSSGPVALAELEEPGELRRRLDNLISLRAKVRKRPERAQELPGLDADIYLIREKLSLPQRA